MKVKLIAGSTKPLEIMYVAARTCYSEKSPIELSESLPNDDTKWNLIEKVLKSGHMSIAEHVNFTFAIEGISRVCSHQLVRHRHCSFSQQSQRYVEIKEDINLIEGIPHEEANYLEQTELIEILDKYFIWDHYNYAQFHSLLNALYCYLYQVEDGMKAEDARALLPNCTKTNLVVTCNLRELIHICNLRLCTRAQKEIRELFQKITQEVYNNYSIRFDSFLKPKCELFGYCNEAQSCGRKPRISY